MASSNSKRQTLWHEQKGLCLYCKTPLKSWNSWDSCLDHIYPRSLGGEDSNNNLAVVCYTCNSLKSDFVGLGQVIYHFFRMFRLFWCLLDIPKVQTAIENGKIKTRKEQEAKRHCDTCTCEIHNTDYYGREKIPNIVSKMATPPASAIKRSVRVEAYERRRAAFQRIKGTSSGSPLPGETQ